MVKSGTVLNCRASLPGANGSARELVYLAISGKLIEGSPQNTISTVPVMPWGGGR